MPITPAIIEAANLFRARLLARERRAAGAMVQYYRAGWQRLQTDIGALSAEVDAMRLAGEEVTRGKIARLQRMQTIQAQVETELQGFATFSDEAITGQKLESIFSGERESAQLIGLAFPPGAGVNVSFYQMPRGAVRNLAGFLQDGSPLLDVIEGYVGSAATDFGETMVTGLIAGTGPREMARELRNAYGMGLTDALRLSRTENLRAYRTASRQTYEANSDIVKGWERFSARDDLVCMACVLLDGKLYDVATDMDDHVMGRCSMLPVTKTYAELGIDAPEPQFQDESAREWFERQPEATQRQMMGAGKFDAWKDGKFTLDDLPQMTHSDVWGDSWTPKPLYELLGESGPVGTYAEWVAGQEVVGRVIPTFGNAAEAIQWGLDNGVAQEIVFTRGVKLDGVNEIYGAVLDVRERFGVSPLRYLGNPKEAPGRIRGMGKSIAAYSNDLDSLVFRNLATDATKLSARITSGQAAMAETAPISRLVDIVASTPEYSNVLDVVENMSERRWMVAETPGEITYHEMGHRLNYSGGLPTGMRRDIASEGYHLVLSEYSKVDQSEFFAEGFTAYMKGENDRLHPDFISFLQEAEKK